MKAIKEGTVVECDPLWFIVGHCGPLWSNFGQSGPPHLKSIYPPQSTVIHTTPVCLFNCFSLKSESNKERSVVQCGPILAKGVLPTFNLLAHPKMYISNLLIRSLSVEHKPQKNEGHQWENCGPIWSSAVHSGPQWFTVVHSGSVT